MIRHLRAAVAALLLLVLWQTAAHATASGAIVCTGVSANFASVTCPDINEEITNLDRQGIHLLSSVSGTNTITASASPYALTSYQDGQTFRLKPANNNTSTVTLNINSLGAKAVVTQSGSALASSDLLTTTIYLLQYYASDDHFRVMGAVGSVGVDDDVPEAGDFTNLTGGSGIDNNAGTLDLDLTEISSATWGAGSFTTFTFDAGATDPTLTFGSGTAIMEAITSFRQADAANAGGQIRLLEDPGTGSNYIAFLAPSSIASDRTCSLVDGSAPIPDSCVGNGVDDTGTVSDGNYGDITVSGTGTAMAVNADSVALTTDTTGNYVGTVADGTGIDGTCSSEGCTFTPVLDLTEINSATFGSGTFTTLTFDAGATDPVWTYGSNTVALTSAATFKLGSTTSVDQDDYASTALTPALQASGTTAAGGSVGITTFANSATTPASLNLGHAAGASVGTFTAVTSGDDLAVINFTGADGTNNEPAASILVEADAATGANDMPGRMTFATTADGAATPTARLTLDSAGVLFPATNDGVPLGKSGNAFADLWLASGGLIEFSGGTTNTFTCAAGDCTIEGNGLYRAGGTDVAVADGGTGASSLNDLITLGTHTTGSYVQQVADGTGIDGTVNTEAGTYTPTLDLTEISSMTWGAGAFTSETYSGAGAIDMTWNYATSNTAILTQTDAGAAGPILDIFADSASPAASDAIAQQLFTGRDSAANKQTYAQQTVTITDATSTSEDATMKFGVVTAGTVADEVVLDGASFSPNTSDGNALGTGSLMWSDLFLASGGVINFNNGNMTITHSASALTVAGGAVSIGNNALTTGTLELANGTANTLSASAGTLSIEGVALATASSVTNKSESFCVAASDETTALTTGTAKATFRMPYAFTVTAVRMSVTTAATGANLLTVDINEGGTTIISTKLTTDASEKTSTTAATPAVISDSSLADDAEMTIDIDQIGNTVAGAGLKVCIIGHQ